MRFPKLRAAAAHAAAALCLFTAAAAPAFAAPVKNIVLVHGAFVDGGGWRPVYDILTKDGYKVTLVQEPLTSFGEDVTATKRVLATLDGPCVLVGHSYGGAIITEAGNDDHVKSLVYIAAHALDVGETDLPEPSQLRLHVEELVRRIFRGVHQREELGVQPGGG